MNSSSLSKLVIPLVIILGALWLAVDILSSGGNALGKFYFYLMIASAVFGLLAPRGAFFYLIFQTAYLDYFKRLMILDAGMSYQDLYYVLGMAPSTVCGIMASLCYSTLQGKVPLARGQGRTTAIILVGVVLATFTTVMAASSGKGRAAGDAVNTFIYGALMLIVPVLFPTPKELEQMLRRILYIFIPAGLYILYHGAMGITSWEMAYVKSGFTIEIRMLAERYFRPFGTMSSAAAASAIFSILAVLALYGPWGKKDRDDRESGSYGLMLRTFGTLLFAAAAAVTLTRTGWVSGIIALGAALVFRSKALTSMFYVVTGGLTLLLMLAAESMLKNKTLFTVTDFLGAGGSGDTTRNMAFRVTTFTERLQSFQNLFENTKMWTPFGWKMAGYKESQKTGVVHDAISDALLSYGYVPLIVAIFLGFWAIRRMHLAIAASTTPLEMRLSLISAGCLVGTLAGCFSVWSQIRLFPVNFYLWLFPSIIFALSCHRAKIADANIQENPDPLDNEEGKPRFVPGQGRLVAGRFA